MAKKLGAEMVGRGSFHFFQLPRMISTGLFASKNSRLTLMIRNFRETMINPGKEWFFCVCHKLYLVNELKIVSKSPSSQLAIPQVQKLWVCCFISGRQ